MHSHQAGIKNKCDQGHTVQLTTSTWSTSCTTDAPVHSHQAGIKNVTGATLFSSHDNFYLVSTPPRQPTGKVGGANLWSGLQIAAASGYWHPW